MKDSIYHDYKAIIKTSEYALKEIDKDDRNKT